MRKGRLFCLLGAALCWSPALLAANRFFISSQVLPLGTTGNRVSVKADIDQALYGFSVHIQFDASRIRVTAVEPGAALVSVSPEYMDGVISTSPGRLVYGVVTDTSDPISKSLPPGTNLEVLRLVVDVVTVTEGTALFDFNNQAGPPSRLNVMTDTAGLSVTPVLVDGTMTISDLRPSIESYLANRGQPGQVFQVTGVNFGQPGLSVSVCGAPAAFMLLPSGTTVSVTAPACAPGPAVVTVCNQYGCDTDPQGFTYDPPPEPPVIDGVSDNSGLAGKTFTVAGRNFNAPGLVVRVCDVEAEWTLLPGGEELEVDAPACASTGWQALEVCTNYGCDSEAMGFFYAEPAATLFVRGDANDDGLTDISDPLSIVFDLFLERPAPAPCRDALDADDSGAVNLADAVALLDFLFLNGAVVPLPFPQPGADPTADPLPSC